MLYKSENITLRGSRIHLRRSGSGTPVLFLHGAAGVPKWLPFFERLSEHFEVIVPDHPGFGNSDTPTWLRNIGDMAYFYLDLLDALNLRGANVIGSSLGGWIAAEAAVRDPRAFKSMSLLAPSGLRVLGAEAGDVFLWTPIEMAKNLYFDSRLAEQALQEPMSAEAIELQLKNKYTTARLAWEPRFFNPDLQHWLHRIKVPVQLLWGAEDRIMPLVYANAWCAGLPDCHLHTIDNCGHLPHIEKQDRTADAILTFLKGAAR